MPRKQSTKTQLQHLRAILSRLQENDFSTVAEDHALTSAIAAIEGFDKIRASISQIVAYNWVDERDNFREEEEGRESHIFRHLVTLDNWLSGDGDDRTPESYLRDEEVPRG